MPKLLHACPLSFSFALLVSVRGVGVALPLRLTASMITSAFT